MVVTFKCYLQTRNILLSIQYSLPKFSNIIDIARSADKYCYAYVDLFQRAILFADHGLIKFSQ